MASTGSKPSWPSPSWPPPGRPGRSGDEHLLRGGHLAGHGSARIGRQYPHRGTRGAGGDRGRRAGRKHPGPARARHPDRRSRLPGQRGLAGADVPGRGGNRFALLTPFFFLRAGPLISAPALVSGAGVIAVLLLVKLAAKMIGVWPVATAFKLPPQQRTYTTLLMATGLTFGSIAALFGLTHNLIDKAQATELVTVVILSAFVPTLIAQQLFKPTILDPEEEEALGEEDISIIRHGTGASPPRRNTGPGELPGPGGRAVTVEHLGTIRIPRGGRPVRIQDELPAPPVDDD